MANLTQDRLNEQLFDAVYTNDIEAAREALKNGADINSRNPLGSTPLQLAASVEHIELGNMLIDNGGRL